MLAKKYIKECISKDLLNEILIDKVEKNHIIIHCKYSNVISVYNCLSNRYNTKIEGNKIHITKKDGK